MHGEILALFDELALIFRKGSYFFYEKEQIKIRKKNLFFSLTDRVRRKLFLSHVWISEAVLCINFDRKILIINFRTRKVENIKIPFPMKCLN